MKIVLDSNVLLAALLKDALVRFIILTSGMDFYSPKYCLQEIKKHEPEFLVRTGLNQKELNSVLCYILKKVKLVEESTLELHIKEAKKIIGAVDPKDVAFIAAAIAVNADGIWSFDRHFERQNRFKVFTTQEIINLM